MVHTVDPETQRPGFLAATNTGLYRSYDLSKGWQKLSFGPGMDPRTTCISTNLRQPETILVGTPASGVLITKMVVRPGVGRIAFRVIFQSIQLLRIHNVPIIFIS